MNGRTARGPVATIGVKTLLRTLQSEFPALKEARESAALLARRALRVPHERDFAGLRHLRVAPGECFVDVGANRGQSIESIRIVRKDATIVSFEANPLLARRLARRYAGRSGITIVPRGIADAAGRFALYVPSYKGYVYDALASLDRAAAGAWLANGAVRGFDPRRFEIAELPCELETLDAHALQPAFIKVDVERFEFQALRGARETLRRHEPVLLVESYRSDPRTVALLEEFGYAEFSYDGRAFRRGAGSGSPNSYLITPRRLPGLPT